MRARSSSVPAKRSMRLPSASAISEEENSPLDFRNTAPAASRLPSTSGRRALSYRMSRTCCSRMGAFSSTTTISSSPSAKRRMICGSSGQARAIFSSRMPARSPRPRSASAWRVS